MSDDNDVRLLKHRSHRGRKGYNRHWRGHKGGRYHGKQIIVTVGEDEGSPRTTMEFKSVQLGCQSSSSTKTSDSSENIEYGLHVTGGVCGLLDSMVYPVEVYIRPLSLKLDEDIDEPLPEDEGDE